MSGGPSTTGIAQSILVHVCTQPQRALPDAWLEALVASRQAEWLVEAAERTMVAGLLWSALTPAQRGILPKSCCRLLQSLHLGNALRWQACRKLLIDVAGRLADAEIPVAVLKGGALLLGVYPDSGQRTITDLDLLVPQEHLAAAHALLSRTAAQVGHRHPDRHLETIYLAGEAGSIEVHGTDPHRGLWPQTGDLFATGTTTTLDGVRFVLPDHTNLWLHLGAHGLSHAPDYWPRMAADLARLQGLPRPDGPCWPAVWQAACGHGAEGIVLLAAALAGGGRVPAELRRLGDADADCDRAEIRAREAWGLATAAAARDFGPWPRHWVAADAEGNRHLLAYVFLPRAVVMRRLRVPMSLATILYPGYVLHRGLKLARTGLAWRAALRLRDFPEWGERP